MEDQEGGPSSLSTEAPHDIDVYHISDPEDGKSILISWDGNGYDRRSHWIEAGKENAVVDLADFR